jgi:hypothetical protein
MILAMVDLTINMRSKKRTLCDSSHSKTPPICGVLYGHVTTMFFFGILCTEIYNTTSTFHLRQEDERQRLPRLENILNLPQTRQVALLWHFFGIWKILGKGPPVLKLCGIIRKIRKTTMASLSAITDITKPIDFSIFSNSNKAQLAMTKEQQAAMEKIATFTNDTSTAETVSADMELDNAIQELMPWMKVMRTKDGKEEESVITDSVMMDSMMKKSQRHDDHPRAKR